MVQTRDRVRYAPSGKGHVELMLAEDVASLGQQGDIVRVKPGYARNYLLPYGKATIATEEAKQQVEEHRKKLEELQVQRRQKAKKLAEEVAKYSVTLEANANEEGHLYGSIMAHDISKELKKADYPVEPEHIQLEGPLKELGMYTVKLKLHAQVDSEVKVWVVPAAKSNPN